MDEERKRKRRSEREETGGNAMRSLKRGLLRTIELEISIVGSTQ